MSVAPSEWHSIHSTFQVNVRSAYVYPRYTPDYEISSYGSLPTAHRLCDYLLAHIHSSAPADHLKFIGHPPKLQMLDRTLKISNLQPLSHLEPGRTMTVFDIARNDVVEREPADVFRQDVPLGRP